MTANPFWFVLIFNSIIIIIMFLFLVFFLQLDSYTAQGEFTRLFFFVKFDTENNVNCFRLYLAENEQRILFSTDNQSPQ